MVNKSGLVALSVMATLVVFGGNTAEAKSQETDKTSVKKTVVTIKAGDTLSAIASDHKTSYVRLFNANNAISNPDVIFTGDNVRIPKMDEKLPDRFASLNSQTQAAMVAADEYAEQPATAPISTQAPTPAAAAPQPQQMVARGSSSGNTYAYGWCTWYAKEKRPDLPNNLGNGGSWAANAAAQGIPTGSVARAGAIAEMPGHVAYVESVNGNMMTISEMGWNYTQGQYNSRTVPVSDFSSYIY